MARVHQITEKAQLAPEFHYLYDRIAQARGRVGGPYSILLHTPGVADKVDALSAALRNDSQLTPQEFVLTALGVARAKDCLFVWSVQAPAARRAGISDEADRLHPRPLVKGPDARPGGHRHLRRASRCQQSRRSGGF